LNPSATVCISITNFDDEAIIVMSNWNNARTDSVQREIALNRITAPVLIEIKCDDEEIRDESGTHHDAHCPFSSA
jgi:hypothetical protein